MLPRGLAFGLILISTGLWLSTEPARAQSRPGQSAWLTTESQHFEIHYLPALAREVDVVVRSAERAYDQISGRLDFVFGKKVPSLSQLSGSGGFADEHLNDALGHAAFDCIESRWGRASIRRFVNALVVPRVDKTYDAVLDLTPTEFDAAFRQYAERQFTPAVSPHATPGLAQYEPRRLRESVRRKS
jgi:hypothetical protein